VYLVGDKYAILRLVIPDQRRIDKYEGKGDEARVIPVPPPSAIAGGVKLEEVIR